MSTSLQCEPALSRTFYEVHRGGGFVRARSARSLCVPGGGCVAGRATGVGRVPRGGVRVAAASDFSHINTTCLVARGARSRDSERVTQQRNTRETIGV